jgi:hypothetical protein
MLIFSLAKGIRERIREEVTDITQVITSVRSAVKGFYGNAGENNLTLSRGSGTAILINS